MINYNLVKNIEGWCSQEKMIKMVSLILATKPERVVEIGVFYGKSLICQALALKKIKFTLIMKNYLHVRTFSTMMSIGLSQKSNRLIEHKYQYQLQLINKA